MANPHGTPIWYELLTDDAAGSKRFYDGVLGWTIATASAQPGMDYRMIATAGGDNAGGMMPLTDDMRSGGVRPMWLFYIGVDDVGAAVAAIEAAGGTITMPAFTIDGVGRMALAADPAGVPFYVMRGASPDDSTAFSPTGLGKCAWNELSTPDQAAANLFYGKVFGWSYPDSMPMGAMGDYMFIDADGQRIGATMTASKDGPPPAWQFYFRATDIDVAAERVRSGGGTVHAGPMDVPGGDRIIVASDPSGAMFGVVASGATSDGRGAM